MKILTFVYCFVNKAMKLQSMVKICAVKGQVAILFDKHVHVLILHTVIMILFFNVFLFSKIQFFLLLIIRWLKKMWDVVTYTK
jgi:hypothetical protein